MPLNLSPESAAARDLAKRCVPPDGQLDVGLLLAAVYHTAHLAQTVPELSTFFDAPTACRDELPEKVPLAKDLVPSISSLAKRNEGPISPKELFVDLLWSPAGMSYAEKHGLTAETLDAALAKLGNSAEGDAVRARLEASKATVEAPKIGWRATARRKEVLATLGPFGRMLTEGVPPQEKYIGGDEPLQALLRALVKRKQRSAIVTGAPGTGKTALIRELARRLAVGHPSIPARLADHDVFELSPTFLKAGTTLVGQYEERISKLITTLSENPRVIVFVDEIHSLFQSGIHSHGSYTDANETFKKALSQGDFSLIGATTTAEFRHYLEPDQALVQRFSVVWLDAPTPAETLAIIRGRLPEIERFYDVEISDEILRKTVDLTEEYLPGRAQPRKSIQLLDEVCAYCVTRIPPLDAVDHHALWEALEDTIGHAIAREETLTQELLLARLSETITGQDEALTQISRAFVAGLGGWGVDREAPRGVYFFGGPTGVGKTHTALLLAEVLGGGRASLVRVDCNTLQASGGDAGQALSVLLGPPPGYVGYVRGKGGALSRIREHPESIVLFDEIEKADPAVGEILLQIMDSGRCEDNDGNLLDFRRAFIVFTTNAGAEYSPGAPIGFGGEPGGPGPSVDVERMKDEVREIGFGDEFLGRISHFFVFRGLQAAAVETILDHQLEKLQDIAEVRGYRLAWDAAVTGHLVAQWQPRFGVRHLLAVLRNRIVEQLSVADAQGELKGVSTIRLELLKNQEVGLADMTGVAVRARSADTLVISLG